MSQLAKSRQKRSIFGSKKGVSSAGISTALSLGLLSIGLYAETAIADPAPAPPLNTILPDVFCFRFTNIKAVKNDKGEDKFQIAFEVLNWSDKPVGGVRIALNTGTTDVLPAIDNPPVFAGAGVDNNGRPLGKDADPLPGNKLFNNLGEVVGATDTAVQWTAKQLDLETFQTQAIPNSDLLGVSPLNGTRQACGMVPGCQVQGANTPVVADWETVDDGNNILDGFVLTVDDIDEGEGISFNWNLLDENGDPIGTPGNGNAYGFGTVNLFRIPIDEQGNPDATFDNQRIFPQNTGFGQTANVFADNSHEVTEYGNAGEFNQTQGFNSIVTKTSSPTAFTSNSVDMSAPEDNLIALFGAEFGAGITAPFVNPTDNIFNSAINAYPIGSSDGSTSGGGHPDGGVAGGNSGGSNSGGGNSGGGNSGGGNSGGGVAGGGNSGGGNSGGGVAGGGNSGGGNSGGGVSGGGNSDGGVSGGGNSGGVSGGNSGGVSGGGNSGGGVSGGGNSGGGVVGGGNSGGNSGGGVVGGGNSGGNSGGGVVGGGNSEPKKVPEPTATPLAAIACGGLMFLLKRRRQPRFRVDLDRG